MRVLVMESDPYAADEAARELSAAGHDVVRCFERDLGNFPCNALLAGGPLHPAMGQASGPCCWRRSESRAA